MVIDEQIKTHCVRANISMAEMARRVKKAPQAVNQKIKRGSFTLEELPNIALVAGCELKCEFLFSNGDKVIVE